MEKNLTTKEIWLISGIVMLGLLISFLFMPQSLRLDESQSLWQINRTPVGILHTVGEDVHVPLYHFLLYAWQFIGIEGVTGARLLSLIFFLLAIPAVYFLASTLLSKRSALFAALLLALSPFLNWYGDEIRMYTLLTLITVLNQYFFIKIYQTNQDKYWIGYAITAVTGIYTHYFFGLILLTEALIYFLYAGDFSPGSFKRFVIVALIVIVAFSPWVLFVMSLGGAGNTQPSLQAPSSIDVANTFSQFLFGFQTDERNTIILSLWPLSVLLGFLAINRNNRPSFEIIFLVLSVAIPVGIAYVVSVLWRPIYLSRYLILTLPALYLTIMWVISSYPPKLAKLSKIAIVVLLCVGLGFEATSASTPVDENYHGVADYLTANVRPQDAVVISSPFTIYPLEYYYHGSAVLKTFPVWNRFQTGPIPNFNPDDMSTLVSDLQKNHDKLYVVLSYDQGYQNQFREYLDTHLERIDARHFSPGLDLYTYKLYYSDK